ncbi:MAG: tetratricopeptide repeat protein [Elusimicrobia bacterium]|nr:tetratricopeptide repeat protein [Elusimicrobiota bacterium]
MTILAYLPALNCGFVNWDDPQHFLLNESYRGLGWQNLRWMFTAMVPGHYQPLTWLSLALDYKLWGMDPFGYHLSNVLIHAANAGLLCVVCLSLVGWPPQRNRRPLIGGAGGEEPVGLLARNDGWSLAVAALLGTLFWSLHPLRVESVAWVTERRDVLSTFFYLAAILCYLRWAELERRLWWWAALSAYLISLLSKSMGMTLFVVLLILDFYPLRRRRLLEKVPFAALGLAAAALAYAAQAETKALNSLAEFGAPERLCRAAYGLVFYLVKTLWPAGLSPLYEILLPCNPFAPRFLLSGLAVCGISLLVWLGRRRLPGLAAAMAFYAVTVSPVLGLVAFGNFWAADRFTYVPALGFSVLAAGWLGRDRAWPRALCAVLLLALGGLTWRQCGFWRDTNALWGRVLALKPATATAHHNLGVALAERGEQAAAVRRFRTALTIQPRYPLARRALADALYNQGNSALRSGQRQAAIRLYQEALGLAPGLPETYNNLGLALAGEGRNLEACGRYRQALRLRPRFAAAHYNLGNALADRGRLPEAEQEYRRALDLEGSLTDARFNLANTLARQGRYREAAGQYRAVLKRSPDFPRAREHLAAALRLGAPAGRR